MLAPRKKLWSTPDPVVLAAIDWVPLSRLDKVCDIGCGDGRVILRWAEFYSCHSLGASSDNDSNCTTAFPSFVGIDIDSDRITQAKKALVKAQTEGRIDSRVSVMFHCMNALEALSLLHDATVLFLYLIPRGLRIFKPVLSQILQQQQQRLRNVLTYMSHLPDETPVRRELIPVPHQAGAAWPLYLYQFESRSSQENDHDESRQAVDDVP